MEVLSSTTEAFDRGGKFGWYRQFESVQEYVMIAQDRQAVDRYRRREDGLWVLHPLSGDDELHLESINFRCPIEAVYEDVDFPDPATTDDRPQTTPAE